MSAEGTRFKKLPGETKDMRIGKLGLGVVGRLAVSLTGFEGDALLERTLGPSLGALGPLDHCRLVEQDALL
jgi:hypothetical protein